MQKSTEAGLSLKKTSHLWLSHAKKGFIPMGCDSKSHPIIQDVFSMKFNIGKKIAELEIMTLQKNLACFQTYGTNV